MTFWAAIPKRSRDLDNLIKATLDLLQTNGIIENDRHVCEISAKWDRTIASGRMRVEVRQALPPELRMSAAGRQRLSASRRGKPHISVLNALAAARAAEAREHAPQLGKSFDSIRSRRGMLRKLEELAGERSSD